MQVEDDFLHKVLDVTVLRAAHEHHPVVGEALHGGFFPHLGAVPQLELHLHGTLRAAGGETAVNDRKATRSTLHIAPDIFFSPFPPGNAHKRQRRCPLHPRFTRVGAHTPHPQRHPTSRPGSRRPGPSIDTRLHCNGMLPPLGRGSGVWGKREKHTQPRQARQQMHRKQIRRLFGGDAGAVSRRGRGGSRDSEGGSGEPPP